MGKKNFSLLVLVCSLLASTVSAQWKVGVQAGYTNPSLWENSGFAFDPTYGSRGGFAVCVPGRYELVDWFGLLGGGAFSL